MTEVVQGPNRMTQDAVRDDVPIEMHPLTCPPRQESYAFSFINETCRVCTK